MRSQIIEQVMPELNFLNVVTKIISIEDSGWSIPWLTLQESWAQIQCKLQMAHMGGMKKASYQPNAFGISVVCM